MTNLPLRFALRYLFARKSHNVINIISGISVAGMAIGTAALIIILSVFNGFNKLVSDSLGDAQPDLVVKPATGKAFVPDSTTFAWLYDQEKVFNMSSIIEEQAFIAFEGKQSLARVKGVDSVFEEESPLRDHITDGVFTLHRGTQPRAVMGSGLAWSMDINPRFVAPLEIYYPDREGTVSLSNPAASLRSAKVKVDGIFAVNAELDAELVIVPIETMRELLDYDNEVTSVEIRVTEGTTDKELKSLVSELETRLGADYAVLDRYRQNEALYKMMRYEKLAIYMILIFIVIIIALGVGKEGGGQVDGDIPVSHGADVPGHGGAVHGRNDVGTECFQPVTAEAAVKPEEDAGIRSVFGAVDADPAPEARVRQVAPAPWLRFSSQLLPVNEKDVGAGSQQMIGFRCAVPGPGESGMGPRSGQRLPQPASRYVPGGIRRQHAEKLVGENDLRQSRRIGPGPITGGQGRARAHDGGDPGAGSLAGVLPVLRSISFKIRPQRHLQAGDQLRGEDRRGLRLPPETLDQCFHALPPIGILFLKENKDGRRYLW